MGSTLAKALASCIPPSLNPRSPGNGWIPLSDPLLRENTPIPTPTRTSMDMPK